MRPSRTTLAGSVAAAAYAAAQVPGLPPQLDLPLKLTAAAGLAALGWHAADCPPNCPGTDSRGHRRPFIAGPLSLALFLMAAGVALCSLCSCVSPAPPPPPGETNTAAWIVSPQVTTWSNAATAAARDLAPAVPAGSLLPELVAAIFGLVGVVSAAVARSKSRDAAAMARAVARAGQPVADSVVAASHPADDQARIREQLTLALARILSDAVAPPPPQSPPPPPARSGPA